ncbi:MAG: hypothetical protein M0D53_13165 [Flavobacterium sp. JAD_PAG50586_2]|nr:MAG: hypothetical protein M0D53_13165 [Flavobacterium sp. JAD_PAG50586_2]
MSQHTIRFATLSDVDAIMNFIDVHWKKDHILATNKDFSFTNMQMVKR